jgi:membrane fusion protein, multidrug efflux system
MRRVIGIALGIGVVAVLGWLLFFRGAADGAAGKAGAGKGHRREGLEGPVPVALADVSRRDVPVYLDGLGTVQAFNTVTVRPQIDGKLISVAFREGQEVHAGDVLAQIDARSFQAQLDQALAKKAQDEALYATAKRDLERYTSLVPDGYVSKQQLDTQRQTAVQLEASVKADEAAIQNAKVSVDYARIT